MNEQTHSAFATDYQLLISNRKDRISYTNWLSEFPFAATSFWNEIDWEHVEPLVTFCLGT